MDKDIQSMLEIVYGVQISDKNKWCNNSGPEVVYLFYNGEYPHLCTGRLFIVIDDKAWDFGEGCLTTTGSVDTIYYPRCDEDGEEIGEEDIDYEVYTGPWEVKTWEVKTWPEDFPTEYQEMALDAINDKIEWGCCGGCT